MQQWLRKSLRELAPASLSAPLTSALPSDLVTRCEALLDIPLQHYSIEDLRLAVGQQLGLPWVVPLALSQLAENLFCEGDYYAGDLLASVLRLESNYWQAHPADCAAFKTALTTQLPLANSYSLPRAVTRAALPWIADFETA